jgi:site-specific DNA recombinase
LDLPQTLCSIGRRSGNIRAFLSPRIIAAIVDGTVPADLTVSGLAKVLPYSWIEQEQSIGL